MQLRQNYLRNNEQLTRKINPTPINELPHLVCHGTVTGDRPNLKIKLMGVLVALTILNEHPDISVSIYLDDDGVVKKYKKPACFLLKQMFRTNCFLIWELVRHLSRSRSTEASVNCIKGQNKHSGNDAADNFASLHNTAIGQIKFFYTPNYSISEHDLKIIPIKISKEAIDGDFRTYFKDLHILTKHVLLMESKT